MQLNQPTPLSVYIIASNEADRIARTIANAKLISTDVLVVEDGKSTDDTVAVATAAGARVIINPWPGFGPQKFFAEENCLHDWVLCLDADEVITPELAAEITALLQTNPPHNFYQMKVVEVYPGHSAPRPLAKAGNIIRLFNKKFGRTSLSKVHDRVELPPGASVGQLNNICLHYSIRSLAHLIQKYDAYTTLQAQTLSKPKWLLALRLLTEYPMAFMQYYIMQRHFTGGLYGLCVARIKANARWQRIAKMWELAG